MNNHSTHKKSFKLLFTTFLAFVCLGSTSCLDIFETYHFRKDGSGTAEVKIDMSQMMTLLESFKDLFPDSASEAGGINPEDMLTDNTTLLALEELKGISKVKSLNDAENNIMGYRFDFANVAALNKAMINVERDVNMGEYKNDGDANEGFTYFELSKKALVRHHPKTVKMEEEENEYLADMFDDAEYNITYTFERNVRKSSYKNGAVDKEGKTVKVVFPIQELIDGTQTVSGTIKIK